MFEGKHIHYSPQDNKPLCSYSNKLCRQRRLNRYGFCIRHILEDKSAPFKQCGYVTTRNNSQKCLNAIPSDQDRGYCHSHLQVIGIIPKTERKSKVGVGGGKPTTTDNSSTTDKDKIGNETTNSSHSQPQLVTTPTNLNLTNIHSSLGKNGKNKMKTDSCSTDTKYPNEKKLHHPPDVFSNEQNNNNNNNVNNGNNTHSINFIKLNGLSNNVNVHSLEQVSSQTQNKINAASSELSAKTKTGKKASNKDKNIATPRKTNPTVPTTTTAQQIQGKKKVKSQPPKSITTKTTDGSMLSIHSHWKAYDGFNINNIKENKVPAPVAAINNKIKEMNHLKELKLLKTMRKLPLFFSEKSASKPSDKKNEITSSLSSSSSSTTSTSSYHYYNYNQQDEQKYNNINNNNDNNYINLNTTSKEFSHSHPFLQLPSVDRHLDPDVRLKNRKEFLLHVSSAYKSHLQTITRVSKLNKQKDEDEVALRDALFACSLTNPRLCAQVLMNSSCSNSSSSVVGPSSDNSKNNNNNKQIKSTNDEMSDENGSSWRIGSNVHSSIGGISKSSHSQSQINHPGIGPNIPGFNNVKHEIDNASSCTSNGLMNLLDTTHPELKLLTEFNDDQSSSILFDSSPWMNGGIVDIDGDDEEESFSLSHSSSSVRLLNNNKASKEFSPLISHLSSGGLGSSSKLITTGKLTPHNKSNHLLNNNYNNNGVGAIISENSLFGSPIKKRRLLEPCIPGLQSSVDPNLNFIRNGLSGSGSGGASSQSHSHHSHNVPLQSSYCSDYPSMGHLESALRSPASASASASTRSSGHNIMGSDGILPPRNAFDSSNDPSSSSTNQPDFINDDVDDLADSFEIDQEITNQASKLLEDNGFTEDDFIDFFPERSLSDSKFGDLGLGFEDIDYAFLTNNFQNALSSNGNSASVVSDSSISVTPNF